MKLSISFLLFALVAPGAFAQLNPVPLINQPLVPAGTLPLGAGFTLTINGTGFVPGSTVEWNGSSRATTYVSSSQLTAAIPASDTVLPGSAPVTVVNPTPGGGTSDVVFFEINNPTLAVALARSDLPLGGQGLGIGTADFNGDGKLDLAVVAGDVSIFLGNGDGTFGPRNDYVVCCSAEGLAIGDFNGDGRLDLATATPATSTVSVLFGNGDGTFGPAMTLAVSTGPSSVAVGDFNHDGKLDLAVTLAALDTVAILLGNGDGTFQPPVTYPSGGRPENLTVGDFNGDGKLDLAVGNTNVVSILLGNGDGTFQTHVDYSAGGTPESLTVADLNGDGKLDLAVANDTSNSVSILLGNGDGTFLPHVDYPTGNGPFGVTSGDFNGDGKLDLAVVNFGDNTMSLLLGNGDATFQTYTDYAVGSTPAYVAAGDFDNNGRLDLASSNQLGNSVSVLLNAAAPSVVLSPSSLRFATQLVGAASAPKTVTLNNNGTAALENISITVSGDFSITTNTCGASLTVNASCTITVIFKPTAAGQRTGSLTITDSAVGSPQIVPLTGTGTVVSLTPAQLNFGDQLVGTTSAAKTVTLTNTRSTSLSITNIATAGADPSSFGLPTSTCPIFPATLGAGASCTISVTFTPAAAGAMSALVSITDNGGGSPQTVVLTGSGTVVKLAPARLIFGNVPVGTTSPAQTVQLTNTGATSLNITNIALMGADPLDFSQRNFCLIAPSTLAAGASCLIHVTFTPTATGTRTANVSVSDGGGGSPQTVPISGTGN